MTMFYRGQKVTMKQYGTGWTGSCAAPEFGVVYTIRDVVADDIGEQGLLFVEIVNPLTDTHWEPSFCADEFRPVVEPPEVSFTLGADPESERWDNRRRKIEEPAR